MIAIPQGFKMPIKKQKPTYIANIKQALNGYIVFVEEDNEVPDSETMPELEEQMEYIFNSINNAGGGGDNEIKRIIRENNKKIDKNELPKFKKCGVRVFATFNEAAAFLSFIFDEKNLESNTAQSIENFTK